MQACIHTKPMQLRFYPHRIAAGIVSCCLLSAGTVWRGKSLRTGRYRHPSHPQMVKTSPSRTATELEKTCIIALVSSPCLQTDQPSSITP